MSLLVQSLQTINCLPHTKYFLSLALPSLHFSTSSINYLAGEASGSGGQELGGKYSFKDKSCMILAETNHHPHHFVAVMLFL